MARPRENGGSGSLGGSVPADYRQTGVKRKNMPRALARVLKRPAYGAQGRC